jgi:hypothetical protein
MKRLLALLLLLSSPALYAQQLDWTNAVNVPNIVVNPTMDNCAAGQPTCGAWKEAGFPLGDWVPSGGGKLYTFSYLQGTLYQDIDLSQYETNLFNFTFSFDLNNSCRNFIGGSCSSINGPIDPFSVTLKFYDTSGLNNSFTFLSGTPSTANIGCVGGVEILGLCLLGQEAQSAWQSFGWYSHVQSNSLFTSARLEFTGRDAGFWAGLYGPSIDNPMLQINYMPPPLPTSGGLAGMNVSAPGSDYIFIYKGNDPILFSQLAIKGEDLVGWTAVSSSGEALKITSIERPDSDYLFLYTEGIPTSGRYYSFQEAAPITTVDCALSPYDPSCVIDTLGIDDGTIDYTDPQQVLAASETTSEMTTGSDDGSDDGSSDGTEVVAEEEETVVADNTATEDTTSDDSTDEEQSDEEEKVVVAETATTTTTLESTAVAAYRELSDEEKAAILADAISKNVLEGALSIAAEATSAASNAGGSVATTSDTTSTRTTTNTSTSDIIAIAQDNSQGPTNNEEAKQEGSDSSSNGLDVLETGRQIGINALTTILADSATSASDSMTQAESIAATSSESSFVSNDVTQLRTDTVIADINIEVDTSIVNIDTSGAIEDTTAAVTLAATNNTVEDSTQADTFADIMQLDIKPDTGEVKDKDLEFVQQIVAASQEQKQDEVNNTGFSEDEKVTINFDPALANAFNVAPNITNLEVAGVLNNKQEEKSDAEKAADKVVAANKEQQEEINKNYMDADQSGIVAAIGADTDVTSYRTAMIRDNNVWYKPEDIYKNVIYKDNVRGAYFLEKGNTDTYKKMVEEQYK